MPNAQPTAESGAADAPHYTPTAGSSVEYADTDRFGKTIIEGRNFPIPVLVNPQNKTSDSVWGVNGYAGGINTPESPDIPVTKGE